MSESEKEQLMHLLELNMKVEILALCSLNLTKQLIQFKIYFFIERSLSRYESCEHKCFSCFKAKAGP